MLVIRLARTGRKKSASYRVVAAEKSRAATGKFVEVLGHYNPHSKELALNKERLGTRVSQGAQPSDTVLRLMVREGMELPKWAKLTQKQRAPKKEVQVQADAATSTEVAADAPAEPTPEVTEEAPAQETAADAAGAKN